MKLGNQAESNRDSFGANELAMADFLHAWDPIGVYNSVDPNPDETEYDDLVRPLIDELAIGVDARALEASLTELLARDYALDDPAKISEFCDRVVGWWESGVRS